MIIPGSLDHDLKAVINILKQESILFQQTVQLTELSWLKWGGIIHLLIRPKKLEDLALTLDALRTGKVPFMLLGNASNLFFPSSIQIPAAISLRSINSIEINEDSGEILAEAGASLSALASKVTRCGLNGFSGLIGIPATLGGAIYMNAGSYGCEISTFLDWVEVVLPDGSLARYSRNQLAFTYRSSVFRTGALTGFILRAKFTASKGMTKELDKHMEYAKHHRKSFQECAHPNLGSVFAGNVYEACSKHLPLFRLIYYPLSRTIYYFNKFFSRSDSCQALRMPYRLFNYILALHAGGLHYLPFISPRNMNCFINSGMGSDGDYLGYIAWLKNLTKSSVPVENEILTQEMFYHSERM